MPTEEVPMNTNREDAAENSGKEESLAAHADVTGLNQLLREEFEMGDITQKELKVIEGEIFNGEAGLHPDHTQRIADEEAGQQLVRILKDYAALPQDERIAQKSEIAQAIRDQLDAEREQRYGDAA